MNNTANIQAHLMGLVPYEKAFALMQDLCMKRQKNLSSDQLLLLEHPPIITMGRRDSREDLKSSEQALIDAGIDFKKTDRGGKLTYHGPGQLVVYFIFDIQKRNLSIGDFVCKVEEVIIHFFKEQGESVNRDSRNPGLWVGNDKIASVGFHVQRGVTTHGIALNLSPDLTAFNHFVPCGIQNAGVTSLKKITGKAPDWKTASLVFLEQMKKVFEYEISLSTPSGGDAVV